MDEEEFEQLQAALAASMVQNEEIVINSDDEGDQPANPGIFQQMMGMFGGNQQQEEEEDKKE